MSEAQAAGVIATSIGISRDEARDVLLGLTPETTDAP